MTQVLGLSRCEVNSFATGVFDKFWAAEPTEIYDPSGPKRWIQGWGWKFENLWHCEQKHLPVLHKALQVLLLMVQKSSKQWLEMKPCIYRTKGDSSCEPVGYDMLWLDVWIINSMMSSFNPNSTPPGTDPSPGIATQGRGGKSMSQGVDEHPKQPCEYTPHETWETRKSHPKSHNWLLSPPLFLGDASLGMTAMGPEGCRSPILRSQSATVERSSSAPWFDGLTDSHDSMNQYQHVTNIRICWIDGGMDGLGMYYIYKYYFGCFLVECVFCVKMRYVKSCFYHLSIGQNYDQSIPK